MAKFGIPEKIVKMLREFYDDFKCAVEDQGKTREWFDIKTGVKVGILVPDCHGLGNANSSWRWRKWYYMEVNFKTG